MFKNKMRFIRQPVELAQKLAKGKIALHSWYSYDVTHVDNYYAEIIRGF